MITCIFHYKYYLIRFCLSFSTFVEKVVVNPICRNIAFCIFLDYLPYLSLCMYEYFYDCNFRYVCWSAYMIKRHPKLASALGSGAGLEGYTAKIPLDQKFYFQYFVQDEIEDGTLMDTKVPVKEVSTQS